MAVDQVATRALLVCRDIQAIETVCHCAQQMAIQVELCPDTTSAARELCHNKFEAVIVDLADGPATLELIIKLHRMTSHKKAVIFAICDIEEQRKAAFQAGATFSFDRPLSPGAVLRTPRAAYPMLVTERRRYFRYPLEMTVFVKKETSPEFKARSVNLSQAGMALLSPEPLTSGDHIQIRLCLPSTTDFLTLRANVCWTNSEGQAGVEFQQMVPSVKEHLQNWLAARFEECTPPVATKAT